MNPKRDWIDQTIFELNEAKASIAELEAEVARLREVGADKADAWDVMVKEKRKAWSAGRDAAAAKVESHPMRFAGMTEDFVRKELAAAIRALPSP